MDNKQLIRRLNGSMRRANRKIGSICTTTREDLTCGRPKCTTCFPASTGNSSVVCLVKPEADALACMADLLAYADVFPDVVASRSSLQQPSVSLRTRRALQDGAAPNVSIFEDQAHSGVQLIVRRVQDFLGGHLRAHSFPESPSKLGDQIMCVRVGHSPHTDVARATTTAVPQEQTMEQDCLLASLLGDTDDTAAPALVPPVLLPSSSTAVPAPQEAPSPTEMHGHDARSVKPLSSVVWLEACSSVWHALHTSGASVPTTSGWGGVRAQSYDQPGDRDRCLLTVLCATEEQVKAMSQALKLVAELCSVPDIVLPLDAFLNRLRSASVIDENSPSTGGKTSTVNLQADLVPDSDEEGDINMEDLWGLDGSSARAPTTTVTRAEMHPAIGKAGNHSPPALCCMTVEAYISNVAPLLIESAARAAADRQAMSVYLRASDQHTSGLVATLGSASTGTGTGAGSEHTWVVQRVDQIKQLYEGAHAHWLTRSSKGAVVASHWSPGMPFVPPVRCAAEPPGDAGKSAITGTAQTVLGTGSVRARYPPHVPLSQLQQLIRRGLFSLTTAELVSVGLSPQATATGYRVVTGQMRTARGNARLAFVRICQSRSAASLVSGGVSECVLVGLWAINRAVDGDEVAVLLLPAERSRYARTGRAAGQPSTTVLADVLLGSDEPDVLAVHGTGKVRDGDEDVTTEGQLLDGEGDVRDGSSGVDPGAGISINGKLVQRLLQSHQSYGIVLGIVRRRSKAITATVMTQEMYEAMVDGKAEGGQHNPKAIELQQVLDSAGGSRLRGVQSGGQPSLAITSGEDNTPIAPTLHRTTLFAIPTDQRLPPIRLPDSHSSDPSSSTSLIGQRVVVSIDEWSDSAPCPKGHHTATLGPAGDIDTEVKTIMLETGVDGHVRPFPLAAIACLPVLPPSRRWSWSWYTAVQLLQASTDILSPQDVQELLRQPELYRRLEDVRDLRWDCPVASVDPIGCTDIDDALSVRISPDAALAAQGCIEVGVHIADVTRFMLHGSALDIEARARGTTVYLTDRRLDMLPGALSENVCSLRARVDRCAMSVLWTLRPVAALDGTKTMRMQSSSGPVLDVWSMVSAGSCGPSPSPYGTPSVPEIQWEVVPGGVWIGRTLIRSSHALTYDQAADLIANKVPSASVSPPSVHDRTLHPDGLDAALADLRTVIPAPHYADRLHPTVLDPAAHSAAALAIKQSELEKYGNDPIEGGLCGSPVHPSDYGQLAIRMRLLASVAHWLKRKRGRNGELDLDSGEMRFVLAKADGPHGATRPYTGRTETSNGQADAVEATGPAGGEGGSGRAGLPKADTLQAQQSIAELARPTAEPVAVSVKHSEDIHNTIAELMIFANEATAALSFAAFPQAALLRKHAMAEKERFEELAEIAATSGVHIDASSKVSLASSLDSAISNLRRNLGSQQSKEEEGRSAAQSALLRALTLRAMTRAEYLCTGDLGYESAVQSLLVSPAPMTPSSPTDVHLHIVARERVPAAAAMMAMGVTPVQRTPGGASFDGVHELSDICRSPAALAHFGLGIGLYTHFTSPIRRYADDVVHRVIAAALGLDVFASANPGALRPSLGKKETARRAGVAAAAALSNSAHGNSVFDIVKDPIKVGDGRSLATLSAFVSSAVPSSDHMEVKGHGSGGVSSLSASGVSQVDGQRQEEDDLLAGLLGEEEGMQPTAVKAASTQATSGESHPAAVRGSQQAQLGGMEIVCHDVTAPFGTSALSTLAEHLNERNQAAKIAGWETDELFLALFLRTRCLLSRSVVSGFQILPFNNAQSMEAPLKRLKPKADWLALPTGYVRPAVVVQCYVPQFNVSVEMPLVYEHVSGLPSDSAATLSQSATTGGGQLAPRFYALLPVSYSGAEASSADAQRLLVPAYVANALGKRGGGDGHGTVVQPLVQQGSLPVLLPLSSWHGDCVDHGAREQKQTGRQSTHRLTLHVSTGGGSDTSHSAVTLSVLDACILALTCPWALRGGDIQPYRPPVQAIWLGEGSAVLSMLEDDTAAVLGKRRPQVEDMASRPQQAAAPVKAQREVDVTAPQPTSASIPSAPVKVTSSGTFAISIHRELAGIRAGAGRGSVDPHSTETVHARIDRSTTLRKPVKRKGASRPPKLVTTTVLIPGRMSIGAWIPPPLASGHGMSSAAAEGDRDEEEEAAMEAAVAQYQQFKTLSKVRRLAAGSAALSASAPGGTGTGGAGKPAMERGAAALLAYLEDLALDEAETAAAKSAYGTSMSASALLADERGLRGAVLSSQARAFGLQAEKRHARIEKAKKEAKRG